MANDAIGFEVIINDNLLKKVELADEKIKQLGKTTESVSKQMITAFTQIGTQGLDALIQKVNTLNQSLSNTNVPQQNSVTNLGQQATTSIEAIKQLIDSMSKLNQQKVQKLIDDAAYKRMSNDAREVLNLEKGRSRVIAQTEKKRIADNRLTNEQIKTANMRAIAQEKEKQIEIRKSLNEIKRLAKAYKDLPSTLNTKGAGNLVARSLQSTSINQRITSIKNLQNAIKDLDTTDKRYQQTVNKLNSEIARQKQELQKLGISFNTVKEKSSNLLNISDQLQRRLALVFSVSQVTGYVKKLASVRGEFELQQRSLQAILQNKDKANEIFDKVTKLAVTSPFQLKELVTYTKQLAAYKIETEKLYDSTKMLADISAGVGVDMSRMVLAYGQVASANYLRGTELRQFSEAGINVLGGLAEYFTELRGSVVEVDEVFDMVSKRMVRFEHVDEVLRRMTQSGGEFYNMQYIQAQTLKGQISNLQDSIDLMLNSIGESNEGVLKNSVAIIRSLVENWRLLSLILEEVGIAFVGLQIAEFSVGLAKAAENGNRLAKIILKLKNAFVALKTTAMAHPWIALTTVLLGAALAMYKFNKNTKEQNKAYDENIKRLQKQTIYVNTIKEEYEKASQNIKDATTALNDSKDGTEDYVNAQRSLISAQKDQSKALFKLKSEYPEIYNQIKDNIDSTEAWAKAIDELNKKSQQHIYIQHQMKGGFWWWQDSGDELAVEAIEDLNDYENALFGLSNQAIVTASDLQILAQEGKININSDDYKEVQSILNKFSTAKTKEELENLVDTYSDTLEKIRLRSYKVEQYLYNTLLKFRPKLSLGSYISEVDKSLEDYADKLEKTKNKIMFDFRAEDFNLKLKSDDEKEREEGERLAAEYIIGIIDGFNQEDPRIRAFIGKKIQEWLGTNFDLNLEIKTNDSQIKEWVKRVREPITQELEKMPEDVEYLSELFGGVTFQLPAPSNTKDYQEYYKEVEQWLSKIKEVLDRAKNDTDILINPEEEEKLLRVKDIATKIAKILGMDFSFGEGGGNDTLVEKLRILRETYDTYRKLKKTLDDVQAKEGVIEKYGAVFKEAFGEDIKNSMFGEDFFVDDDKFIAALDKLLTLTEDAKKRLKIGLEKGRVEWDIILDAKMVSDAKLNEQVEKMFSDYSSSIELDKMDISPEFAKAFFDIDTTSLEDLKKKLQDLQPKFTGDDMVKQYEEYLKKVEELETKAQQERLKEYLKYTRDAIGERAKLKLEELQKLSDVEETFNKAMKDAKTPEDVEKISSAKTQAKEGVHEETETAIQKLEWEALKSSEILQGLYGDLENTSNKALGKMIDMLNNYRNEWSKLPINEMKEVINLLDKMQEAQMQKEIEANPWKTAKDAKQTISDYGGVEKAEQDLIRFQNEQMFYSQKISDLELINQLLNEGKDAEGAILEYNKKYGASLNADKTLITESVKLQKTALGQIKNQAKYAENVKKANETLKASYQKQAEYMGDSLDMAKDLYEAFSDLYEALGGDKDSPVAIFANMGMNMAETVVNTIMLQMQLAAATVQAEAMGVAMNSAMGIVGWIVMAIQLIVEGIKAIVAHHDNQLQAQIETWAEGVDHLEKQYEKLAKVIENAISFETYEKTFNEMQKNLEQQIANTRKLIEAEQDNKKPDEEKIKEYYDSIEEDNEQMLENIQQRTEDSGGFGFAENFKSASEDFIDAWYNAFKETGNGLSGLEEQFKEVMDNLVKKQMLMKVSERMFQPLLKLVDDYINNDSLISADEMADINKQAHGVMIATNEALTQLADSLGIVSDLGTTELEGLSKGIQGVTEVTAQALEAILNSMRFYVIDNNKQLIEIAERVLSLESPQSPILAELKQQTEYIEEIRTFLNSVISRQGSPSIRVTM